jgi:L-threonylcarbamoyladenylate synthase
MITKNIALARDVLVQDGIVAIPTETVYGLAGNAYSETAVKQIFGLKKRPFFNPLILHIKSMECLHSVAREIPEAAFKLASSFWPGALTLVLKKQAHISDLVTSGMDTVAVRVPNHPVAMKLLEQLDFPLAAPSANPFGSISPTTAQHVHHYFEETLSIVLDGGVCEKGIESTIIGFENDEPVLYRHGAVSIEEIEMVIGKIKIFTEKADKPNAPGMLSRHYAPNTETHLVTNISESIHSFSDKKIGLLLFKEKNSDSQDCLFQEVLSTTGDFDEAARNVYAALHRLDLSDVDVILVEKLPDIGIGKSINDRLKRAVKKE